MFPEYYPAYDTVAEMEDILEDYYENFYHWELTSTQLYNIMSTAEFDGPSCPYVPIEPGGGTSDGKDVVIIPDIAATSLQVTHTDDGIITTHDVWQPRGLTTIGHDVDSLSCDDNGQSVENISIIDTAHNGMNNSIITEYYARLRDSLNDTGYRVHYFPYDWRKDNATNASDLAAYINGLGVNIVSIIVSEITIQQLAKKG